MDYGDVELVRRMIQEELRLIGPVSEERMREIAGIAIADYQASLALAAEEARLEAERLAEAERAAAEAAASAAEAEAAAERAEDAEERAEEAEEEAEEASEDGEIEEEEEAEENAEIAEAVEEDNANGEIMPPEVAEILTEQNGEPNEPRRGGFWNAPLIRR